MIRPSDLERRERDSNGQFTEIDLLRYLWPICLNRVQPNRTTNSRRRRRLPVRPSGHPQWRAIQFDTIAPRTIREQN